MNRKRFLVTGGAGFVGSHVALALAERDFEVVVIDNLRQGHRAAILPGIRLIEADIADIAALDAILANGPWHAVLHFAALSLVGESMRQPMRYLIANASAGIALIDACVRHGIPRFVLSSTAALFGMPDRIPIAEDDPVRPGSPYGESKWMIERALFWADRLHGMRSASLRYFNAAGADPQGRLGEDHHPETHLIPLAIDAALGRSPGLSIFGNDYGTPDGTCIRDYVHVSDLAQAHLLALDPLDERSVTYNLGNSTGHSVLDVLRAVGEIAGRPVPHGIVARRPGDPPVLIASADLIRGETGWTPRFHQLHDMVRTAFDWRSAHPDGFTA